MTGKEGGAIELSSRQHQIVDCVRRRGPITGERIADLLGVTRPMIRADLGLLVMLGYLDAKPKVGYFLGETARRDAAESLRITQRTVREVMSIPVALRETATVGDAVVTLFLENVGSIVVADESGSLAGIVSRKDLLKVAIGNAQASGVPLSMVMTRYPNVVTVAPDDTVREALRKMIAHEVDGLPVVVPKEGDAGQRPEAVGRITKTTIVKLLYEAAPDEA